MKYYIFTLILFGCIACNRTQSYDIHGNLPGAPNGTIVKLLNADTYTSFAIDSTTITDGQFRLKGTTPLDAPHYCNLVFDMKPEETNPRKKDLKAYGFFADNSVMQFHCIADSLPGYYHESVSKTHNVTLTGGKTQDLYNSYLQSVQTLKKRQKQLFNQYLEVYHKPANNEEFNTAEGIELVRQLNAVKEQLNQKQLHFIQANPASAPSLSIAESYLRSNRTALSKEEIDTLTNSFDKTLVPHPLYAKMQKIATQAYAVAKGSKYHDIPLIDLQGNQVNLSSYVKPGMYNMLEFWASWCSPCRGEIPHLRHLYYSGGKEHLNMISISIDAKDADWKNAVAEEHMEWTQLCDPHGFKGQVSEHYQVFGIPYCLILDPDGRIVCGGVRGAELDLVLMQLLGDKIKP